MRESRNLPNTRCVAPLFRGALLLCSLLCALSACQQDTLLLVSINGPPMQNMTAALTIGGKPLDPVQTLSGSETKFALLIPSGKFGSGELRVEGFQGNECVAARGSIPVQITEGEQRELAVEVSALAAHECQVDAASLVDLHGLSDKDIWAVGDFDSVLRWDGRRWNRMPSQPVGFVTGIWAERPDSILLSGGSLQSYNGKSFSPMEDPTTSAFYAVGGVPGSVWAVGELGAIVRYENGMWTDKDSLGQSWSQVLDSEKDPKQDSPILRDIAVTSDGGLWISGDNGILLRWDSSNKKWQRVNLNTKDTLRRIAVKNNDAWIGGTSGNLWRLSSGTWVKQTISPAPTSVFDVFVQDSQTVWLAGARGTLMKCSPIDTKSVKCTDRRFTTTNLYALWGSGQGDLWIAGGVRKGDSKLREDNVGYLYHLMP